MVSKWDNVKVKYSQSFGCWPCNLQGKIGTVINVYECSGEAEVQFSNGRIEVGKISQLEKVY